MFPDLNNLCKKKIKNNLQLLMKKNKSREKGTLSVKAGFDHNLQQNREEQLAVNYLQCKHDIVRLTSRPVVP